MNKILLIIGMLFLVGYAYAQPTIGTRVTSDIVPNDSLDNIATHDDFFGRGGYRSVKTIQDRDNIYSNRRKDGMLVHVVSSNTTYILNNSVWVPYKTTPNDTLEKLVIKPTIAPSYLIQALDTAGKTRFAATHNGLIIAGRGHQGPISVDGLAIIGSNSTLESKNGLNFGRWIYNSNDSALMVGNYLDNDHNGNITMGQGISPSQRLVNTRPNSMAIGYNQSTPHIELTRDTIRLNGLLFHNGSPLKTKLGSNFLKNSGDSTLVPWASYAELGGKVGFYYGTTNPGLLTRLNLNADLFVSRIEVRNDQAYSTAITARNYGSGSAGIFGEGVTGMRGLGIGGQGVGGFFTGDKYGADLTSNTGIPLRANKTGAINGNLLTRFEYLGLSRFEVDTTGNIWSKKLSGTGSRYIGASSTGDIIVMATPETITPGTTSQYWRGDKTWQTLNKTAVGLSNVDNTSDLNKPVSTATQNALGSYIRRYNGQANQDTVTNPGITFGLQTLLPPGLPGTVANFSTLSVTTNNTSLFGTTGFQLQTYYGATDGYYIRRKAANTSAWNAWDRISVEGHTHSEYITPSSAYQVSLFNIGQWIIHDYKIRYWGPVVTVTGSIEYTGTLPSPSIISYQWLGEFAPSIAPDYEVHGVLSDPINKESSVIKVSTNAVIQAVPRRTGVLYFFNLTWINMET